MFFNRRSLLLLISLSLLVTVTDQVQGQNGRRLIHDKAGDVVAADYYGTDGMRKCEFHKYPKLDSLRVLYGTELSADDLNYLSKLTNLKRLELGFPGASFDYVTIDGNPSKLASLKSLTSFGLCKHPLSDDDLAFVGSLPNLKQLTICGDTNQPEELGPVKWGSIVTDRCAAHISRVKNLQTLVVMGGGKLTDNLVATITKTQPNLEHFEIVSNDLTDEALKLLTQRCKSLKWLDIDSKNARLQEAVHQAIKKKEDQKPPKAKPKTENTRAKNLFHVQKQKNQTEVFLASDVPKKVETGIKETLAAAVTAWGSSGRLEYWVLGTDKAAATKLAAAFCKRRVARGDMSERECLRDSKNKDHGFLMYQQIGANALKSGKARGSAGHNGGAEWGIHRMTSSLPLGFAGVLDIAGEGEQVTVLHEYWHSIQHSFIQIKDHKKRRKLMGPVWFTEGSAVAMAEIYMAKLRAAGKIRKWNNTKRSWPTLRQRMSSKMVIIQSKRSDCKTLLPDSYDAECRQLAYEGGGWAIAYLMHKHGEDVLLKSFHPNVEKLGWEACFKKTFGKSSKEFEAEFRKFCDLPLEEQLKILPSY